MLISFFLDQFYLCRSWFYSALSIVLGIALLTSCGTDNSISDIAPDRLPNIIIMYADDVGYGDIGPYGAIGVDTPNLDRMARGGILFTDAHASSATCTPSRYSLLTGQYGFRARAKVLPGDAPLLINPRTTNLASMLSEAGYRSAVIGKWHLGLGSGQVDWNSDVSPGPLEIGFDYSFLIPATGDRVPTVFLENHSVLGIEQDDPLFVSYTQQIGERPTGSTHPELLRYSADPDHSQTIVNGVSRIGFMSGGRKAEWVDEEFADVLTDKAIQFMRSPDERPFFLFYAFHDIHVPRLPHPRFEGQSQMGPRGDAIAQMDWMIGEILRELEDAGDLEKTLILFTSDNGPVLDDGYDDKAQDLLGSHEPWGPFRGGKYSAFEAGARVPTIAFWPGTIRPTESDALISQVDVLASFAALADVQLDENEAIDSVNLLSVFLGKSNIGREILFKEAVQTETLRRGNLKYIAPLQAGETAPAWLQAKQIESGLSPITQLYNLENDIGETNNIADKHPAIVAEMEAELEKIRRRTSATRP